MHVEIGPAIGCVALRRPCKHRVKAYKTATSNRSGRRLNGGPLIRAVGVIAALPCLRSQGCLLGLSF